MPDTNQKSDKGFFADLYDQQIMACVKELKLDDPTMRQFTFKKPKDTLSELALVIKCCDSILKAIPSIPIMEDRNKELIGIISLVDLLKFLPPGDKLPKKYFANNQTQLIALLQEVNAFILKNQSITIEEAFSIELENFSGNAVHILDSLFLNDLFQSLIDAADGKIKYRTLPIVRHDPDNGGFEVRRMWSYIDALQLIIEMKDRGTDSFLQEKVATICTRSVYTLKQDDQLSQALINIENLSFFPTHLPITAAGGLTTGRTPVSGIVDEALIYTLLHNIFSQALAAMPISYIAKPIQPKEIVKLDTKIGDLIEIFINRLTKPTAILVGDYNKKTKEFEMDGIVNYVDLLNRFLAWSKES
ncbi:CBS domain-containing protein [Microcoleus sp. FACHB-68]|uniref:CBS domain-containing protein n=1 Tax=Microcoleus sp. FACHB-68 TaxID=2692826 RepID=UPI0016842F5D|nr:CBS domain-containing protein [Microcoleus sp. FACHB-68]MBD1936524.1 CBS domain-containing protein [Microcoleus sp. FACHB-68]